MRILVIGGTGFIGSHIVRQLAEKEHAVAIYHRGQTRAILPREVREFQNAASKWPITEFPKSLLDFAPDVVIHTFAMSENDATAAMKAFSGRAGRLVVLSSRDVYGAYGRFIGLEPGPIENGLYRKSLGSGRSYTPIVSWRSRRSRWNTCTRRYYWRK